MPALTISAVNTGADTLTVTAHGQVTGAQPFAIYTPNGVLPTGSPAINPATDLWLIVVDANTLKLATSQANALAGTPIIDITGAGSGTLQLLGGLPYRRPMTATPGAQIKSANDNAAWDALVALWNLLTAQAQSIYSGIVLGPVLEATVAPSAKYRDWKGQTRAVIDHFGYRGGLITEWEEHWRTTGAGAPVGWTYAGTGSATLTDPTSTFRQRYNRLLALTGVTNITATPEWTGYMDNDSEIVEEFSVRTEGVGGGLGTNFNVGLQFGSAGSSDDFIYFGGAGGVANWQAYSVVNGVATPVDTGVAFAANTTYRFRIECIGSNNSSQAANTFQYRFFINGVLVTTTNLSTIVADKFRPYLKAFSTAASTPDALQVGRIRLQFNHVLAGDAL